MSANRYAGTCATCHTRVPAGQGYYDGNLWCAEPVRYEMMTMCPTAARWQEASDRKDAERRATQVAPEPTAEEIARRAQIACWSHGHECDAEAAAAYTAQRAEKIAAGEIVKGATVTVVKGRKVAHGTTGTVTWIGEDSYGKARVGFRTADGESIFTAMSNVTAAA